MAGKRTGGISAADVMLVVEGRKIGLMSSFDLRESRAQGEIKPWGTLETEEHIDVGLEVGGSGSRFNSTKSDLVSVGIHPRTERDDLILDFGTLLVEIQTLKGQVLHRITGFKVVSRNFSYNRDDVSMTQFDWVARRHTGRSEN